MLRRIDRYLLPIVGLISIVFISGCAGRNYLMVDFRMAAASPELSGQTVRLQVEDRRQPGTVLAPGAAYQFPDFSGIYSLALIMPDQARVLAGEHQLSGLFETAFEKRLAELGVGTTDADGPEVPLMTITLKQFTLDLKDHKWMADLSYDAALTLKDHPSARENVRGSAERVRVMGLTGADTVISEIFSDVVNRLDIPKLFRNAELMP